MSDAPLKETQPSPSVLPSRAEPSAAKRGEIDIEALAEKVYRLLVAELRLDQARGDTARQRRDLKP